MSVSRDGYNRSGVGSSNNNNIAYGSITGVGSSQTMSTDATQRSGRLGLPSTLTRVMSPSRDDSLQPYNNLQHFSTTIHKCNTIGPVIMCNKYCRDGQAEYPGFQTLGKCKTVSESESGATIRGTMTAERDSKGSSQN